MKKLLLILLSITSITQFIPFSNAQTTSTEDAGSETILRELFKEEINLESLGKIQSMISNASVNETVIPADVLARILYKAESQKVMRILPIEHSINVTVSSIIKEHSKHY